MPFVENQTSKSKTFFGIIAAIAAFGIAKAITSGGISAIFHPRMTEVSFDASVKEEPHFGKLYVALQNDFPDDYNEFRSTAVEKINSGGNVQEATEFGRSYMANFVKSHMKDVAKAPNHLIEDFRRTQTTLIEVLAQESSTMCAHFFMSGLQQGDMPSEAAKPAMADAAYAVIKAAAGGIRTPVSRDAANLSDADAVAFVDALRREGVTGDQLNAFSNPALMAARSDDDQCTVGRAVYRSLDRLPDQQSVRVTAVLAGGSGT